MEKQKNWNSQSVDILYVEDSPFDAELMVRALNKRSLASQLLIVTDGMEALDFLFAREKFAGRKDAPPRVVFLDIMLPRVSGLDVLKEIKANEKTRVIPVVMVSSSREDSDIRKAYAYGANGYVVKPVDFDSFQKTMIDLASYWLLVNTAPNRRLG